MVSAPSLPDPSELRRRQVLAGLGGLGALATGGSVVVGATKPTALPDVVTDEATKHYPTPPEVSSIWEPTVTEDHARTVVEKLASTVDRGESAWRDADLERHFTGAGGWLESARESMDAGKYNEALFRATYGLQFAAEALGRARYDLDDHDFEALGQRIVDARDRASTVANALAPYRAADPGTDLAWYLVVEQELLRAGHELRWEDAEAAANGEETGVLDDHDYASLTAGAALGEVNVLNAERYWRHLQNRLDADATAYGDHLERVADEFRNTLEAKPARDTVRARYGLDDVDDVDPYVFAHSRLVRWCFDAAIPSPWQIDVDTDLRVTTALALGTGIVGWRAHDLATDELVVDRTTTGFDSGHTLSEKRRAHDTYQSTLGDDPDPLLAHQAGRAIEDLQVAVVGFADNYRTPLWKERLNAYLYALVGRAKLTHHPTIYQRIIDAP
jgi:hypothetical protein